MFRIDTLKIGVSGVRGIVGETLTPELVAALAQAFGTYAGPGRIVIGRDTRPTGPMLQCAAVSGLLATGCTPLPTGVCPTPSILALVRAEKAAGGIVLSASHNPIEWNALKFVGSDGLFLNANEAAELVNVYHQRDFNLAAEPELRQVERIEDPVAPHFEAIRRGVDVEAIRARRFRVALDPCAGAGAPFAERFLRELGCEPVILNERLMGRFPRGTEPTPPNLGALARIVVAEECSVGFAQDPDADRLGMVDDRGRPVSEETVLVLAVAHVLEKSPGPVVVNLSTTRAIEKIAERHGCEVVRTKIGEIHVTEKMLEIGAVIGGEGNGGIIYPEIQPCRDSFTGMALILERMATTGRSISDLVAEMPRSEMLKAKVPCSREEARRLLRDLHARFAERNPVLLDGLLLTFGEAWVNLRPSNTEPIVRIVVEAPTDEEARQLLDRFRSMAHR